VPTGRYCGENRYVGVKNELDFWIEPGCTLYVYPRDAIMLAVRLEWTLNEFFADGGIGRFTDRLAAALGIHRADIKVVQVYEGSVIVEFQVLAREDDPNPTRTLLSIEEAFKAIAPTLGSSLGAPLMQILTAEGEVITMEAFKDASGGFRPTDA